MPASAPESARKLLLPAMLVRCTFALLRPPRAIAPHPQVRAVHSFRRLACFPDLCVHRVANRRGDLSDADAGVVRSQFARETGPISWVRLDASADIGNTAQTALRLLGAESR